MAWTTEGRRRYASAIQEVVRQGMLVRLAATIDAIDPPASVGRPRVWPTLVMLQALWHVARDDRAWRRLPPASPPHQTVWSRLMGWRRRAVLDRALHVLVACHRLAVGRKRRPTAAIIDTQSVKTGPQRGPRGYDANKKIPIGLPPAGRFRCADRIDGSAVDGRKRVLMIDTQGDPLGVQVVAADVQDREALRALGPDLDAHASLLLIWLDRGFAGDDPAIFLRGYGISAALVGAVGRKGFQVEPRRWKVEPTFACLQRYRRLRGDDESHHDTSRQITVLASVFMIGMRLQRASQS
jgi:putative transposase